MHIHVYVLNLYIYTCMHAYVYSSIRAHAYMYVCVYMCMYARYISVTNMYQYKTYGELGTL